MTKVSLCSPIRAALLCRADNSAAKLFDFSNIQRIMSASKKKKKSIQQNHSRPRICQSEGPVGEALRIRQARQQRVSARMGSIELMRTSEKKEKKKRRETLKPSNHFEIIPRSRLSFSNISGCLFVKTCGSYPEQRLTELKPLPEKRKSDLHNIVQS